jgi:hypothetical protein
MEDVLGLMVEEEGGMTASQDICVAARPLLRRGSESRYVHLIITCPLHAISDCYTVIPV